MASEARAASPGDGPAKLYEVEDAGGLLHERWATDVYMCVKSGTLILSDREGTVAMYANGAWAALRLISGPCEGNS